MSDLGAPSGENSQASAINERGQVVGYKTVNGLPHVVLWGGKSPRDLGATVPSWPALKDRPLFGFRWWGLPPLGMSDAGQVVLHRLAAVGSGWNEYAFVWEDGRLARLPTLPAGNKGLRNTEAVAINNHDQIVGYHEAPIYQMEDHALLWTKRG